jgi:hypothetical protein
MMNDTHDQMKPTMNLRFRRDAGRKLILQQQWEMKTIGVSEVKGWEGPITVVATEWRDVAIHEEGEE